MSTPKFVLVDNLESGRRGKPVFYGGLTGIGPKYTEDLSSAVGFTTLEQAMDSPAFRSFLCDFHVERWDRYAS